MRPGMPNSSRPFASFTGRTRGRCPAQSGSYEATPDFTLIPVPGHTPGSLALLYKDRYLFTGDHLWWERDGGRLQVPRVRVWDSERLRRSTRRLSTYAFDWVLPGHGERVHLSGGKMKDEMQRLVHRGATQSEAAGDARPDEGGSAT